MGRSRKTRWRNLAIAVVTLPLLATSCVEIAKRSLINGFFGATTPLVDDQLGAYVSEALEDVETP